MSHRRSHSLLAALLGLALLLIMLTGSVGDIRAEVAPAKPYAQLVSEVIAFLESDVGRNGIRTNNDDPVGYPVPPYFYSYAINDGNNLDGNLNGYPGYLSVSYPAYTACVAIDAFLDWRRFSGDPEGLTRAREFADWILEHRTPAGDLYGNLPYSTQTDAVMGGGWDGPAIMTDKPPMFGLRLLRLYDITGEPSYWDGALEIADVLAATQLSGDVSDDGRWPFRVVPADGTVTQDYTSHLMPAVRFFDAMAGRTGSPVYVSTRDRAWQWLLANPCEPTSPSYMRWEAFYEDQTPAMQTGFGDHYSGHEMIVELVARQPAGWQDLAITLLDTLSARFLTESPNMRYDPYTPVTLEWFGWPEATYASSMQYARTALLLHQALAGDPRQNDTWRDTALAMAAACSHGQNNRGNATDGRMFTTVRDLVTYFNVDSWYEQNFNTVIYYLALMNLEPSLAPTLAIHILAADAALTAINFPPDGALIEYATVGGAGTERVKLDGEPGSIIAGGMVLARLAAEPDMLPGWYWDATTAVATIHHETSPVAVTMVVSGVPGTDPRAGRTLLQLRALSPDGSGRAAIGIDLARDSRLDLAVYDLQGRMVRELADGQWLGAGSHRIDWDGRDRKGRQAASGVYLVRGRSGGVVARTRVVRVR